MGLIETLLFNALLRPRGRITVIGAVYPEVHRYAVDVPDVLEGLELTLAPSAPLLWQ
jgi:hypothetical protein